MRDSDPALLAAVWRRRLRSVTGMGEGMLAGGGASRDLPSGLSRGGAGMATGAHRIAARPGEEEATTAGWQGRRARGSRYGRWCGAVVTAYLAGLDLSPETATRWAGRCDWPAMGVGEGGITGGRERRTGGGGPIMAGGTRTGAMAAGCAATYGSSKPHPPRLLPYCLISRRGLACA